MSERPVSRRAVNRAHRPKRRSRRGSIPTVYKDRDQCEWCGSFDSFATYKTIDQGDGSLLKYEQCSTCGGRRKAVYEPPDDGDGTDLPPE
jgi:hypothetical protein